MILHTPRLILTFPTAEQLDGYYHAIIGTNIFDTLIWNGPSSPAELHGFWRTAGDDFAAGPARNFNLALIERETGLMVGSAALRPFNGDPEIIDLGYALAPRFHGRGYATEGVGAIVHHGFERRGVERCFACVFAGNTASRRVLEKIGFAHEGTMRRSIKKRGDWKDEWLFGLTRPDWLAQQHSPRSA